MIYAYQQYTRPYGMLTITLASSNSYQPFLCRKGGSNVVIEEQ
jgi:hypothetical protein